MSPRECKNLSPLTEIIIRLPKGISSETPTRGKSPLQMSAGIIYVAKRRRLLITKGRNSSFLLFSPLPARYNVRSYARVKNNLFVFRRRDICQDETEGGRRVSGGALELRSSYRGSRRSRVVSRTWQWHVTQFPGSADIRLYNGGPLLSLGLFVGLFGDHTFFSWTLRFRARNTHYEEQKTDSRFLRLSLSFFVRIARLALSRPPVSWQRESWMFQKASVWDEARVRARELNRTLRERPRSLPNVWQWYTRQLGNALSTRVYNYRRIWLSRRVITKSRARAHVVWTRVVYRVDGVS